MYPFKYISNDQYYQKSDPHIHTYTYTHKCEQSRSRDSVKLSLFCMYSMYFFFFKDSQKSFVYREKERV